jgi:uncharacterized protein YgfB (UPF0149 family)
MHADVPALYAEVSEYVRVSAALSGATCTHVQQPHGIVNSVHHAAWHCAKQKP